MSLKEIKEDTVTKPIDPIKSETEKESITREAYEAALAILEKQKEAKETVEKFESNLKYEEDPVLEIIEKGVMTVVDFEVIPGHMLSRITAIRYEYEGKIAERSITYLNPVTDRSFLAIKDDKIILR